LLDRQRGLELPQCSDIFGQRGLFFLRQLQLPEPDGMLLREQLALHDLIAQQMKAQEKRIAAEFKSEVIHRQLLSMPGIGTTLAAVIGCEIDQIERFPTSEKLCAYAGVVPTTHASGGKVAHGRLLPFCNKWLRWALLEASWGGHRLFALFWRALPAAPGPRKKSQHRHHHRGPADVSYYLATAEREP